MDMVVASRSSMARKTRSCPGATVDESPRSTSRRFVAVAALAAVAAGCGSSTSQAGSTPTAGASIAARSVASSSVPAVTNAATNTVAAGTADSTGPSVVATAARTTAKSPAVGANPTGRFSAGTATNITPSRTFTLSLESGFFVSSLGAHGATSANWSDPNSNDVGIIGDGNGGYKLSVIGDAAPNGVTQNDCTAIVTKDALTGIEGTFTCSGNITGTFQAH